MRKDSTSLVGAARDRDLAAGAGRLNGWVAPLWNVASVKTMPLAALNLHGRNSAALGRCEHDAYVRSPLFCGVQLTPRRREPRRREPVQHLPRASSPASHSAQSDVW